MQSDGNSLHCPMGKNGINSETANHFN